MDELRRKNEMSILLITHNLAIVAERADRVAVMYASRIVETGRAEEMFAEPMHPYTAGLLKSIPRLGEKRKRLDAIPGNVPNPLKFPSGCIFHPRCPVCRNDARCMSEEPVLEEKGRGHSVACWKV
jgi:oligopeptide/dipeptide ABC transporter ATP-binding protein